MSALKKALSLLLCVTVLCCFTALAEGETGEATPTNATVEISVSETAVTVGDEGLELTIEIDNLTQNLASADVVIAIDSDKITVADTAATAETQYEYAISIPVETPSTEKLTHTVALNITDTELAESPETVNISLVSATLLDDTDPEPQAIACTLGEAVTVEVANPVAIVPETAAKLKFKYAVESADNFAVTYEPVAEEDAVLLDGDGVDEPTLITTILTPSDDGKEIYVTTEAPLAEGTYKINITAPGYIIPDIDNFVIDAENTQPSWGEVTLTAGDVTGDDKVDLYDFHDLCMSIEESEEVKYDLNRDGDIDEDDVKLLVKNWKDLF